MTTELLFRDDAYLATAQARVVALRDDGILLDRTIFYPQGGGQAGDTGMLIREGGERIAVAGTRKGEQLDSVLHLTAPGGPRPAVGETLALEIDWQRRYALMRLHTALHVMADLTDFDTVITDSAPSAAVLDEFDRVGIKLTIAPAQDQA